MARPLLSTLIDLLRTGLPDGLEELAQLGRTLHRRRDDVLAYFTHRASNGPTEAINGRLEALRRNALGFRNLINFRIRSLLDYGALALQFRKSPFLVGGFLELLRQAVDHDTAPTAAVRRAVDLLLRPGSPLEPGTPVRPCRASAGSGAGSTP